jgi:hypothetical protein
MDVSAISLHSRDGTLRSQRRKTARMIQERMSIEQFRKAIRYSTRGKYKNTKVVVDGIRFDSKLEGLRYLYWRNLWQSRAIKLLLRQVPFHLPGGIVYRLDFLVQHLNGDLVFEDTKGVMTRVSQNKIKQVEEIYRIRIDIVKGEKKKCRTSTSLKTGATRARGPASAVASRTGRSVP